MLETRQVKRCARWRSASLSLALGAILIALGLYVEADSRAQLYSPDATVILQDRRGRFLGHAGGSDETGFGYWPLSEPPPRVVAAILAAEDRRFWDHPGVDVLAAGRALLHNLRAGERVSGASTLAMQVARMQSPGRRTYLRKAVETVTALLLTRRYGREAVLGHYLRIVPCGNQLHGVGAAARLYFEKPAADLSWAEAAFVASIPQAPGRMNPHQPEGRRSAAARARRILGSLRDRGALPAAEAELAFAELGSLRVKPRPSRPEAAVHAVLALSAEVSKAGAWGPVVRTALDLELQTEASRLLAEAVAEWQGRGAGSAALLVLDVATREVLASVGSAGYFDEHRAGAIDFTRVPRSSGSTLKPFLYALALDRGVITPATVLDDLMRAPGGVGNADERFLGPLLPRVALANSRNVPAVHVLERVGVDAGYAFLGELGLRAGEASAERYGLGIAVGGLPVSLRDLARAYAALADGGVYADLRWYAAELGAETQPRRRVLSEASAREVALMLSDPLARLPTFPRAGHLEFPFPAAAKTGTSALCRDGWTVAWSARYLVAAWVGRPDERPMNGLGGYESAAAVAHRVLGSLHPEDADGLANVGFPPPRGSAPARLCALTGNLATPACDAVVVEHFLPGREPVATCTAHVRLAVDNRSGLPATPETPPAHREVRTFVDLDPRYAAWQAAAGLPRKPGPGAGEPREPAPLPLPGERLPLTSEERPPQVRITSPEPGLRVLRDPDAPLATATLALSAVVDPPTAQVVWYVDGGPFRVADYPYSARWPIAAGEHVIEARLPFVEVGSAPVRVRVY